MTRAFTLFALALLALTTAALAGDGASVSLPIGSWINALAPTVLDFALAAVGGGLTFVLAKLPAPVSGLLKAVQLEKLLDSAVRYGINQVAGAAHDKTLSVPVGNAVLAVAGGFVVNHAPGWAADALGSPQQIEQRLLAKLNLEPSAGQKLESLK